LASPEKALAHRLAIREILFPTDLTAASNSVIPYLRVLAERYGAGIHAVHVVAAENGTVPSERVSAAEAQMKHFRESSPFPGVNAEFRIERGTTWDSILAKLPDEQIDLIVVGTHGRHGLKKIILGSVAEQIFRQAPCPVITIGPDASASLEGVAPRILCAIDFSPESMRAFDYAVSFAAELNAHLTLLYVMKEFSEGVMLSIDQITRISRERLRAMVPRELHISTDVVVEFGSPADTILRMAEESQCSMIVLGVRNKLGGVSGRLPWTTAYTVACEAHCPVLTVR
jgi:nucleotide-binding universal stress UspA family protein